MKAQEIVRVIGELIPDDGATLKQQHGSQALAAAREIEAPWCPTWRGTRPTPPSGSSSGPHRRRCLRRW